MAGMDSETRELLKDMADHATASEKMSAAVQHYQKLLVDTQKKHAELSGLLKNNKLEQERLHAKHSELKSGLNDEQRAAVEKVLGEGKSAIELAKDALPQTAPWFARIFIGSLNIKMRSREEKDVFKMEYERFKLNATQIVLLLAFLGMYLGPLTWFDSFLHTVFLLFYGTLTLRESILKANGSQIRRWWMRHHYLSIVLSLVQLTWPPGETWSAFRPIFMLFVAYAGLLQLLQYRYQSKRIQVLRALDSRNEMEVTNSDSTQIHWSDSMLFLLPFVLLGQVFQFFNSWYLLHMAWTTPDAEWQVYFAGLTFSCLAVGNLFTTLRTAYQKFSAPPAAPAKKSQ